MGVCDSRQNENRGKRGAPEKKIGGNEWTGPPIIIIITSRRLAAAAAAAKLPLPMRRCRAAATAAAMPLPPPYCRRCHHTAAAFFAELLVRSHRWHCHKAARVEADLSKLGRHSAENQKWGIQVIQERFRGVHGGKFGKRRQYQFRLAELTCRALGTDQNSTPYIIRRKSQGDTQLSVALWT